MTREGSHADGARGDSAFDFVACLASRWGIEKQAAREILGRWMATYEPVKAKAVTNASERPSASGVFHRPGTEGAGHGEKVGAA